jgi:hypothetical protein
MVSILQPLITSSAAIHNDPIDAEDGEVRQIGEPSSGTPTPALAYAVPASNARTCSHADARARG